ncbi:pseudouridine synthase [Cryptosporidium felis]|nr:pseudouridine synthase [Cryptosporidium felis]
MEFSESFFINFETYIEISSREAIVLKVVKSNYGAIEHEEFITVVPPYIFEYEAHCKLRWRNRTLMDLFSNEFRSRPIEEYQRLVDRKQVFINDVPVNSLEYRILNGDHIKHRSLFIELPVGSDKIAILFETSDFLVAFKPCGIPCHPQGRFNKLSLTKIIQSEYLSKTASKSFYIHPINRLDRVTSGLVLLSKSSKITSILTPRISSSQKFYLAKIKGSISALIKGVSSTDLAGVSFKELSLVESYGIASHVIKCEVGLRTVKNREGDYLMACVDNSENGKYALTYFFPLVSGCGDLGMKKQLKTYEDEEYSILLCKPITGRTHQIRVHLQYLGYPIIGDIIYSCKNEQVIERSKNQFNYNNLGYYSNHIFKINDLDIDEVLQETSQNKFFGGGGIMETDISKGIASVDYLIEPPIGICLHSLIYILPPCVYARKYLILKCRVFPKWVNEHREIDILEILARWPHWNKIAIDDSDFDPNKLL